MIGQDRGAVPRSSTISTFR